MSTEQHPKPEQLSASALEVAYAEHTVHNLNSRLKQAGATLEAAKLAHDLDITSGLQELFDRQSKSQISNEDLIQKLREIMLNSFDISALKDLDHLMSRLPLLQSGTLIGGKNNPAGIYTVHTVAIDPSQPEISPYLRRDESAGANSFYLSISVNTESGEPVSISAKTDIDEDEIAEKLKNLLTTPDIRVDAKLKLNYIQLLAKIGEEVDASKFEGDLVTYCAEVLDNYIDAGYMSRPDIARGINVGSDAYREPRIKDIVTVLYSVSGELLSNYLSNIAKTHAESDQWGTKNQAIAQRVRHVLWVAYKVRNDISDGQPFDDTEIEAQLQSILDEVNRLRNPGS